MGVSKQYFEPTEIKRAISTLKADGELFEVRILKGNNIYSGYFNNAETLIGELQNMDLERANVYISLQKLHTGCEARLQWGHFMNVGKEKIPTTADNDIIAYEWLPIDLDPIRPAGISSSDEELKTAESLRDEIIEYMELLGYLNPICAFSGNGYHVLYRIEADTEQGQKMVEEMLNTLNEIFSNEHCHVDTTNKNPSRIFKLYGTLAQKGRDTEARPHRMSKLLW